MATVTVFTAARMEAIEGSSVVSGTINGSGHLILTKHDGTTLDAGDVTGPQGPQGPVGEVTEVELNAAIAAAHAAGAITEEQLATGSVTAIKIGTGAVTTVKVLDGNITEAKLASNAVTNARVSATAAIAASKLAGVYVRSGATTNNTIHVSTAAPVSGDGVNGDVWLKYTA